LNVAALVWMIAHRKDDRRLGTQMARAIRSYFFEFGVADLSKYSGREFLLGIKYVAKPGSRLHRDCETLLNALNCAGDYGRIVVYEPPEYDTAASKSEDMEV
jgi:hypothetical protein